MIVLGLCAWVGGAIHSTVQYSTVQYSTVQYSTVQYSTVQYGGVLCWCVWPGPGAGQAIGCHQSNLESKFTRVSYLAAHGYLIWRQGIKNEN